MNIYLMITIAIANILAITILYQFIKKLDNKEKIIIIAISIATIYILVSITYWISGFGINTKIHEQSKNFITYLFVPVNMILFAPYLANQYIKVKEKKVKKVNFIKKVRMMSFLLIIVLIVEGLYFRNIQNNIVLIGNTIENNETQHKNTTNQIQEENENTANQIQREIVNEM